jgi:hypothetical protein
MFVAPPLKLRASQIKLAPKSIVDEGSFDRVK